MANTDISVTLAGKFRNGILDPKRQLIVANVGLLMSGLSISTAPTVAQWNTVITAALKLAPPTVGMDLDALDTAALWQWAVNQTAGGSITSATASTSTILGAGGYIQGLDDLSLRVLRHYMTNRFISAVYT